MTQAITNTVLRFFNAIDARDWILARAVMAESFRLDYASFGGGPAADLDPGDILASWKGLLPGFDATHHQLGPLRVVAVEGRATIDAYVTATHHIADADGGTDWIVFGRYEIGAVLDGDEWKLNALTFNFRFSSGNDGLPALARARAA